MKSIAYVYSVGGPPVDFFYPKLAARGRVRTYLVTTPSPYNLEVIRSYSDEVLDFTDFAPAQSIQAVRQHVEAHLPDTLFTFAEFILKDVSDIACDLGLRGVGRNVVLARNKGLMRERWQQAGVPQPHFVRLMSRKDIPLIRQLCLPIIVKVAYGCGSIGQQVVRAEGEIGAALERVVAVVDAARRTGDHEFSEHGDFPELIAEELIESTTQGWYEDSTYGDFVSVEGLVREGRYHPLAMTGRLRTVPPFTELGNLAPCELSADHKQRIVEVVRKAVEALGFEDCATHTELKLKANGQVSLLETAARMGGVGIARELLDVFDVDFVDLFLSVVLGEPCSIPAFEAKAPSGGAASVALIGCNSHGAPWQAPRRFLLEGISWAEWLGSDVDVDILRSQSIASGAPLPVYDFASGVLNYGGQVYLRTSNRALLKTQAYRLIDSLEAILPPLAKSEELDA